MAFHHLHNQWNYFIFFLAVLYIIINGASKRWTQKCKEKCILHVLPISRIDASLLKWPTKHTRGETNYLYFFCWYAVGVLLCALCIVQFAMFKWNIKIITIFTLIKRVGWWTKEWPFKFSNYKKGGFLFCAGK